MVVCPSSKVFSENEYNSHNLDVQVDKLRRALKGDPSVSIEIIRKTGIVLKETK